MAIVPKVREILLDEEVGSLEFLEIIKGVYKRDIYIYAIVPEWEEELLDAMSNDFILINKIHFPLIEIFPRTIGFLGYVKDNTKQYIYEFYLRSTTISYFVFSEVDVSIYLNGITKKNIDIYKIFETNKIPHITIGPDGQWINIIEY